MEQTLTKSRGISYRPITGVVLALCAGMGLGAALSTNLLWIFLAGSFASAGIAMATHRAVWIHSSVLLLAVTLGWLRLMTAWTVAPDDISHLAAAELTITGTVVSDSTERLTSYRIEEKRQIRLTLQADSAKSNDSDASNESQAVSGRILVTLPVVGEESRLPEYGDRLNLTGRLEPIQPARNPGARDARITMAGARVFAAIRVSVPEQWYIVESSSTSGLRSIHPLSRLKGWLLAQIQAQMPSEQAGVVAAITLGATDNLTPSTRELFSRSGAAHLIATAGLHVGFVALLLMLLLPLLGLPQRGTILTTLVALAFYVAIVGARPAVVRATIMAAVYLIGRLLEREPDAPNAVAIAAIGLLLANPLYLWDAGFQITFATVITLIPAMKLATLQLRRLRKWLRNRRANRTVHRVCDYLFESTAITLAAQVGSMPLVAYYFNLISPAGFITNLILIPLICPLMGLTFAACAVSAISHQLAVPLFALVRLLVSVVLWTLKSALNLPYAAITVATPDPLTIVVIYATIWLGLWLLLRRESGRRVGAHRIDRIS